VEAIAITREVSSAINRCELSYHAREPIDFAKAVAQHRAYEDCLRDFGLRIIELPAQPDLPDSVFVEDAAIVLDEIAVIPIMGAASRRPESRSIAEALEPYRPLKFLTEPATLDGGDVLRAGKKIFVGLTKRTNRSAVEQLSEIAGPYGYEVQPVQVRNILHLKSACSYLGRNANAVLLNGSFIDHEVFGAFDRIDVSNEEPGAANVLAINGKIIMPAAFPKTAALLRSHGFEVASVDVSELQKAEAGVTCCSLIV